MKVYILSGSPKGETSVTLQTAKTLEKLFPEDSFTFELVGSGKFSEEIRDNIAASDLTIYLSSLYHCHLHAQSLDFFKAMFSGNTDKLKGKAFTYLTTSMFLMDTPAHNFMKDITSRNGMFFIRSLSLKDDDALKEEGREELYRWFKYVKDTLSARNGKFDFEKQNVTIIDASDDDKAEKNQKIIEHVKDRYTKAGSAVKIVKLRDYKLTKCVACNGCYTNRKCVFNDDFEKLADEIYTGLDILVTVGTLDYGMMTSTYKTFLDKHVQFGRCPLDDDIIKLYLYSKTDMTTEYNEHEFYEHGYALDSLCGSYFADCFEGYGESLNADKIDRAVDDTLLIAQDQLYAPRNVYRIGLNTMFAKLAVHLQNMCPGDMNYYSTHGFYDPVEINPHVRIVNSFEEGIECSKSRVMPYKMMMLDLKTPPKLTDRRKDKDKTIFERAKEGLVPVKKKRGLFGKK